ncbi:MAG: Flp pilus assembly protein CpaB, partial [Desulfobulbaceae bacterium]|nr:Flp pilus assembly protein CpaB [Desulfobulbaceae bacterium]
YGALIALGSALLFGILAVFIANKWLSKQTPSETGLAIRESLPITKIVIASEDISIGAPLTEKNITLAEWPSTNLPKGHFTDIKGVTGRVAVTKLVAGEPLLAAELAAENSGVGLVALIPPGMRAMSIRVDEVIGVSGFVLPNTYVDIISVANSQNGGKKASTILKRILVLAIAQETLAEEGKPKVVRTVTLQLSPKETEKLALTTSKGSIQLVLRNPLEGEKKIAAKPPETPKAKVATRKKGITTLRPRISRPPAKPHAVEIIRQTKRQNIRFKNMESEERL